MKVTWEETDIAAGRVFHDLRTNKPRWLVVLDPNLGGKYLLVDLFESSANKPMSAAELAKSLTQCNIIIRSNIKDLIG
jgi:hypothetical protein